ncbi:MAG: hypothetical protein ACI976_002570, partial [Aureispira sp.]
PFTISHFVWAGKNCQRISFFRTTFLEIGC